MGHNVVIPQSLYTEESGVSERIYQNHDQKFTLLWSFGQVFEHRVIFRVYDDELRLITSGVRKWPQCVPSTSAAEKCGQVIINHRPGSLPPWAMARSITRKPVGTDEGDVLITFRLWRSGDELL